MNPISLASQVRVRPPGAARFGDGVVRTTPEARRAPDAVMLPDVPRPEPALYVQDGPWGQERARAFAASKLAAARHTPSPAQGAAIATEALAMLEAASPAAGNMAAAIGMRAAENMQTDAGKLDAAVLALGHLAAGREANGVAAYALGRRVIDQFQTPEGRGRAALGVLSGLSSAAREDAPRIAAQVAYQAANHQASWSAVERAVVASLNYMENAGI